MKVLFYNHTGKVSGAERVLLMALKRLDRERFDPVVVCPAEDTLAADVSELAIPVRNVRQLNARFTLRPDRLAGYVVSFWRSMSELRAVVRSVEPGILHANSVRAGMVASVATIGMRLPVVWHLHDEMPRHPITTAINWFAALSPRVRLISTCRVVAETFGGPQYKFFKKNSPVRVVENAIELERFEKDPTARERIRKELGIGLEQPLIGTVGLITPRKGQLGLIRAFADVRREIPDAVLLIVGAAMFNKDELYLERLKSAVAELGLGDSVHFAGPRKDVPAIMQSIDLLAVNSQSETLLLVAIEAMACGTPVVATNVGGIVEIIEHKINGWLVRYGKHSELVEGLTTVMKDRRLRTRFADAGERMVRTRLHADRFIRELQDALADYADPAAPGKVKGNGEAPIHQNV
jgi:L-malate glycosyltransferase